MNSLLVVGGYGGLREGLSAKEKGGKKGTNTNKNYFDFLRKLTRYYFIAIRMIPKQRLFTFLVPLLTAVCYRLPLSWPRASD